MEKRPPRPMTPFDELTMPSQFRMMKLMLPYTPATIRPMLAIYIKFMEFQHTMRIFSENPDLLTPSPVSTAMYADAQGFASPPGASPHAGFSPSMLSMIEEILPYLAPQEQEMFETMRNLMNMMEMMQLMQEMQMPQEAETSSEKQTPQETPDAEHATSHVSTSDDTPAPNMLPPFNPMDFLQNMLPPGQQELFRTYQNIFEQNITESNPTTANETTDAENRNDSRQPNRKGDVLHE